MSKHHRDHSPPQPWKLQLCSELLEISVISTIELPVSTAVTGTWSLELWIGEHQLMRHSDVTHEIIGSGNPSKLILELRYFDTFMPKRCHFLRWRSRAAEQLCLQHTDATRLALSQSSLFLCLYAYLPHFSPPTPYRTGACLCTSTSTYTWHHIAWHIAHSRTRLLRSSSPQTNVHVYCE